MKFAKIMIGLVELKLSDANRGASRSKISTKTWSLIYFVVPETIVARWPHELGELLALSQFSGAVDPQAFMERYRGDLPDVAERGLVARVLDFGFMRKLKQPSQVGQDRVPKLQRQLVVIRDEPPVLFEREADVAACGGPGTGTRIRVLQG